MANEKPKEEKALDAFVLAVQTLLPPTILTLAGWIRDAFKPSTPGEFAVWGMALAGLYILFFWRKLAKMKPVNPLHAAVIWWLTAAAGVGAVAYERSQATAAIAPSACADSLPPCRRCLNGEARARAVAALRAIQLDGRSVNIFHDRDDEATLLARQLRGIFYDAGWQVTRRSLVPPEGALPSDPGVILYVDEGILLMPFLLKALSDADVEVADVHIFEDPGWRIPLWIGPAPVIVWVGKTPQ